VKLVVFTADGERDATEEEMHAYYAQQLDIERAERWCAEFERDVARAKLRRLESRPLLFRLFDCLFGAL
jgi:hypothetical protein